MNKVNISVLLSVYNGEKYLEEAIQSILDQSYPHFEFLIVNDASTDNSKKIIESFSDPRIQYFENSKNLGASKSMNKVLKVAKGEYIAKQDADDISFPDRFKIEIEFLEKNKDIGLVGGWTEIWKETEKINKFHKHPTENNDINLLLLFNCPFVHSSIMFRKECFEKAGDYNEGYFAGLDYEILSRMALKYKMANLPQILGVYREVSTSISRSPGNSFENVSLKISIKNLSILFGEENLSLYKNLSSFINKNFNLMDQDVRIEELEKMYNKIVKKILGSPDKYSEELWNTSVTRYHRYHHWKSKIIRFLYGK